METLTIHQKINLKGNAQKLYSIYTERWWRLARMIRNGYPSPGRFSPEVLIPKQWLEFRETKEPKHYV